MLDPILLQTFLAIAQTRSFTRAAERLGLRQSTVSQHIRKLEDEAGRRLFVRDTHSVTTTADGEAMIEFARSILAANERTGGALFRGLRAARPAAVRRLGGFCDVAFAESVAGVCSHTSTRRIRAHGW